MKKKLSLKDYRRLDPATRVLYYDQLVEDLIREKYTVGQELAILRQRDIKIAEFNEYNSYAEECKRRAKEALELI